MFIIDANGEREEFTIHTTTTGVQLYVEGMTIYLTPAEAKAIHYQAWAQTYNWDEKE